MINNTWFDPQGQGDENPELIKILALLDATKHPDVTEMAEKRKEMVFDKIEQKIADMPVSVSKLSRISYLKGIAAIGLICVLSGTAIFSFLFGKHIEKERLTQTCIELKSPEGIRSEVELPDGTKVTLNGGSLLSYPLCFSAHDRKIELQGEGYFNVAKDAKRPFIVKTSNLDVHVLGTIFNLSAYPDDPKVMLTLEEGKVEALIKGNQEERIILTPNQQLSVIRNSGEFSKSNVNPRYFSSWRKGEFYFRGITFGEIAVQLERYFNVEISFKEEWLTQERYFSQFDNQENIYQILDLLSYRNHWTYRINGRKIEISEKFTTRRNE